MNTDLPLVLMPADIELQPHELARVNTLESHLSAYSNRQRVRMLTVLLSKYARDVRVHLTLENTRCSIHGPHNGTCGPCQADHFRTGIP